MTTLLAHIRIKPGKESKWEAIMADMVAQTFANETSVTRYEYWKGQEENAYYCLLSFADKWAFYRHQMSPHHEGHDFADVLADIRLEYVDPVKGAGGGLARTEDLPPSRSSTSCFPVEGKASTTLSLTALSKQNAKYCRTMTALASSQHPGGSILPASISCGRPKKNRSWGR